ncbi:RNA-directed DNA polymerase, eukaryota [Artemisia annua]|uniref:RNA-directed DNA polymerase, eukaryota n=1 Tax=Artemisia annua TaxID=35608 RepID=A0A2U1PG85_ARTAN|nr:RNA-directed DNA polymerase, eukaryota [Artemisia annua]
MTRLEMFRIKSMWGNYTFDYACSLSRGRAGGLISVWDPSFFVKDQIWCDDWYIIVQEFIHNHDGHYVIFGDLNEVPVESERYGTEFSRSAANVFNTFIDDAHLFEPVLGGHNFTWMNKAGTKMSKLDRFLISQHVMDVFTDVKVTALPRGWSDHTPIMLHCDKVVYGPIPFKFFHSWLQRDGFNDCIKMAYNECSLINPHMPLHQKLKVIKEHIKCWTQQVKNVEIDRKHEIISKINNIETKIDSNIASEVEKEDRIKLLKEHGKHLASSTLDGQIHFWDPIDENYILAGGSSKYMCMYDVADEGSFYDISNDVCLCCATTGSPFISTLELRLLNLSMYANDFEDDFYLKVAARANFAAASTDAIRSKEVEVQVLKPPSQKTRDVIENIYVVEKPKQYKVNNPQGARNKGGCS